MVKWLAVATCVAVVGIAGCLDARKSTPASAPKVWAREEFKALVIGKTPEEVIAAVGKPDKTQERSGQPGSPTWYYDARTKDPVSGKVDYDAQVIFENGRVVRVNY